MDSRDKYIHAKNAYKVLLKQRGSGLYCLQNEDNIDITYNSKYDRVCTRLSYTNYSKYVHNVSKYLDDFVASLRTPNNPTTECLLYILDSYIYANQHRLVLELVIEHSARRKNDIIKLLTVIAKDPKHHKYWHLKSPAGTPAEYRSMMHTVIKLYSQPDSSAVSLMMTLADYPALWKIQISDAAKTGLAGLSPLHLACEHLVDPAFANFWIKMAAHTDLWKIQLTDAAGEGFAGVTPLHVACFRLLDMNIEFWLKMADYPDLWKIQMKDAAKNDVAGRTPLHIACEQFVDIKFQPFLLKMADYPDLWKIQIRDGAGAKFAGQTSLHLACEMLFHEKFMEFWLKMADYPDLWKIQTTDAAAREAREYSIDGEQIFDPAVPAGETPLHVACGRPILEFREFWLKMAAYPDLWNVELSYVSGDAKMKTPLHVACYNFNAGHWVDFWRLLHKHLSNKHGYLGMPVYKFAAFCLPRLLYNNFMQFEHLDDNLPFNTDHTFVIHSHSSDTTNFYVVPPKVTIVLLEEHKKYGIVAQNLLEDVLYNTNNAKMMRIYRPADLMLDKTIGGDHILTPHFYNSTEIFIDDDANINRLPNTAHELSLSQQPSTLFEFVKMMVRDHSDLPEMTIIMAGCRVDDNLTKYKQMCKWISLVPFACGADSKWFDLCNFKNKLSYLDNQSEEFQLTRLPSFASETPSALSGISDLKWMKELLIRWNGEESANVLQTMISLLERGEHVTYTEIISKYKEIFDIITTAL